MKKSLFIFCAFALCSSKLTIAQNPVLYGITRFGGPYFTDGGTAFKIYGDGSGFDTLFSFTYYGDSSTGSFLQAKNGLLYGLTAGEGVNDLGVIFSYDINKNIYTDIHDFNYTQGEQPFGSLIQGTDEKLYGMAIGGGAHYAGVIFNYDLTNNTYTDLYDFPDSGCSIPYGSLIFGSDGKLYGMTSSSPYLADTAGGIFSFNPSSGTFKILHRCTLSTGTTPYGDLIQLSNGLLYGMTYAGGKYNGGVLFSLDTAGNNYTDLHDFGNANIADGAHPLGNLILASNGKLYGMTSSGGIADSGIIFWYNPATNQYNDTTFYNFFVVPKGAGPTGSLLQASNGLLYGMTNSGGLNENGVVFSIDTMGKNFTDLHYFDFADGSQPFGNLIQIDTLTTGINQLSVNSNQLSVYPNPAGSFFHVGITLNKTSELQLHLVNILGQTVWNADAGNVNRYQNNISVANLVDGVYLLEMVTGSGMETREVVVAK